MHKYSILLRRPENATTEWPDDVYLAYVEAETPRAALRLARTEAAAADKKDGLGIHAPEHYALVIAFRGHLTPAMWPFDDWPDPQPPATPTTG